MGEVVALFEYNGLALRVTQDAKSEPWFVAKDVCTGLAISDVRQAVEKLDDDERCLIPIMDNLGRDQETWIINEPGLYRLTMRSRKHKAKEFQRWVIHEVLPAIRKTGSYGKSTGVGLDETATALANLTKIVTMQVDMTNKLLAAFQPVPENKTAPPPTPARVMRSPTRRSSSGKYITNPLYKKMTEQWYTVTDFYRGSGIAEKISFETCRRAIYDGRTNVRSTIILSIATHLGFSRVESKRLLESYGHTDLAEAISA